MRPPEPRDGRTTIWAREPDPDDLNAMNRDSMAGHLGIRFTEYGDDYLRAEMPVDHRTTQPFGLLHGGASVVMGETLGSVASYFCLSGEGRSPVGLTVQANHLRAVRSGEVVTGTARPLHLGRSTHVWEVEIENADQRLVAVCRLTVAILDRPQPVPD